MIHPLADTLDRLADGGNALVDDAWLESVADEALDMPTANGGFGVVEKGTLPAQRITFSPVYLANGPPDAHGDYVGDSSTLEEACGDFLKAGRFDVTRGHGKYGLGGAEVIGTVTGLMCWPYPVTAPLHTYEGGVKKAGPPQTFPKDSMWASVTWTRAGWDAILRSEVRGLSLFGTAMRTEDATP